MVLANVDQGKAVRLDHINGGSGIRARLHSMGLMPGTAMTVLSRGLGGPVVLSVNDSRLAIGRGMAMKIVVE